MRKIQFLRRFATCSLLSCLLTTVLTACQTTASDTALSEKMPLAFAKSEVSYPHSAGASVTAPDTTTLTGSISPAATGRGSLTMEAAVQRAVSWHPSIDESAGRIYQSDARIRAAQAGYYPKVSAGVNSGYQSNDREGWRPEFKVSASQLLYDFGKVSSSVETERAGKAFNNARLLLTVDNLSRDTANAVIEVQRYKLLVNLAQVQLEGIQRIAGLVTQRTDKGASTMSDKVQADARVESALATQLQFQSELSRWQSALSSLLGGGSPEPGVDVPAWLGKSCDIVNPDWEAMPAILEAQARKEEAVAQLQASRADAFPTVSLEASTGYDLNASRDRNSSNDRQPDYSVGVNVSSSLYNGGQTGARKRAAAYALQSADAAISTARLDAQRSLMESRSQIGALSRLMGSLDSRAGMMVKTRDLYREQYIELGTRTLLDLLNAEQELHEARFQSANTVHDLRRLNISCLYSSGKMREGFRIETSRLRQGGDSL